MNKPEELNLSAVFQNCEYIVPIYQRSYAWEKDEIEQIIEDIIEAEENYYLGNLIVDKVDSNVFSVIDGQQRLTTLFLILAFIKPELLSANSLQFEAREKSNRTLKYIKEGKKDFQDDSSYCDEILFGKNVVESYLNTHINAKDTICNRLEQIKIIRTQVPKKIDLNHYFEIMNTRGEQLELHEIAKGRILSKISDEKERQTAATIWDACSQMDSYIQMNFHKDVREKLFGKNWDAFCFSKFGELVQAFNLNNETAKSFSLLEKLENPQSGNEDKTENKQEENERFESIVSFPNFLLLVTEALKTNVQSETDSLLDDKKFISIMENHWKSNETATKFIFNLLKFRFLFDTYIVKREYAKDYKEEGHWSLQKLYKYRDGNSDKPQYKGTFGTTGNDEENDTNKKLKLLQSALRITYTSPKTMHWIAIALKELNKEKNADLILLLEKYSCEKIKAADFKKRKGFAVERIVFTYLDYVLLRDKKVPIVNYQFQFRNSIEHFYPQHPENKEYWEDEDLNSFGNLALVTVKSNSKFSNLPPMGKVDSYAGTIEQSPKLKLMAEMAKKDGFTKEDVHKHEKEMFDILDKEIKEKSLK